MPTGINDALVAYQGFLGDLEKLQQHLDPETNPQSMASLGLIELQSKLESLSKDTDALANLGERAMVMARLRTAGLADLARDLGRLHTTREYIALELDQAWWQSALESVLARDASVLSFTPKQIEANEIRFRVANDAQVALGATSLSHDLSLRWQAAIAANPNEAGFLKNLLRTREATLRSAAEAAPSIWPAIAPAIMASPYELPVELPQGSEFDVVLVLDAAGSSIAENLAAIKRAKQIIAFGDDAIATPTGFEIESRAVPQGLPKEQQSVFQIVRSAFGAEVLRRSYRTTSQTLAELINREFYQNRIQFVPSAAEYFGENNFLLDLVDEDNRAKTTIEGATESLDAELARVVELVYNHALWHPEQSLMVASASVVHAERIRNAVREGLHSRANLVEFFNAHGREKFEVVPIAELTHRLADRVIFSLGYGRTSHGAVLSTFGQLSEPQGRRYLANLLVSARTQITVVSCFAAEDVPSDRLSNGATLLKDLLEATTPKPQLASMPADPMLVDLSLRLKKLGARIDDSFSTELPLIASFGKSAAVIEPDWSIPGVNRTERFRIRPGLLRALGWQYTRVYSFELFSDPQAVALRIAENLGMQVTKRPQPLFDEAERAFEDSDMAWGDRAQSNEDRLRQDKPPHWG